MKLTTKLVVALLLALVLSSCKSGPNLPPCTGAATDVPGKNCRIVFGQKPTPEAK